MVELLSLNEIQSRFDGEWILMLEPETDESLSVKKGLVVFHSPDRDEVYRKAIELKARFAVLYTGSLPDNTAIVL